MMIDPDFVRRSCPSCGVTDKLVHYTKTRTHWCDCPTDEYGCTPWDYVHASIAENINR